MLYLNYILAELADDSKIDFRFLRLCWDPNGGAPSEADFDHFVDVFRASFIFLCVVPAMCQVIRTQLLQTNMHLELWLRWRDDDDDDDDDGVDWDAIEMTE